MDYEKRLQFILHAFLEPRFCAEVLTRSFAIASQCIPFMDIKYISLLDINGAFTTIRGLNNIIPLLNPVLYYPL